MADKKPAPKTEGKDKPAQQPPAKKPAEKPKPKPKPKAEPHWESMAEMLLPWNGREGFDLVEFPFAEADVPARDTMVAMLKREKELRLADDFQTARDKTDWSRDLVYAVQKQVAREFGYSGEAEVEKCVKLLRSAVALFPNDKEIREIPFWVKYNRATPGTLEVGDKAPDAALVRLNGSACKLSDFCAAKPLIVAAGSAT